MSNQSEIKENLKTIIITAIKAKLPDWYKVCGEDLPDSVTLIDDELCPHCGEKSLYCCRTDLGNDNYDLHFAHICINSTCDYTIETSIPDINFKDPETKAGYCPWSPHE